MLNKGRESGDTQPSRPHSNGASAALGFLRNLEEGRELLDGFYGLDSVKLTPYTAKYRGREYTCQPPSVEERRQCYETKWRELEPELRAYYKAH